VRLDLHCEAFEDDIAAIAAIEGSLAFLQIGDRGRRFIVSHIGHGILNDKFDSRALVVVAKLREGDLLERHACLSRVEAARHGVGDDESVVVSWHLLHDVADVVLGRVAYANAAASTVLDVGPPGAELRHQVRCA